MRNDEEAEIAREVAEECARIAEAQKPWSPGAASCARETAIAIRARFAPQEQRPGSSTGPSGQVERTPAQAAGPGAGSNPAPGTNQDLFRFEGRIPSTPDGTMLVWNAWHAAHRIECEAHAAGVREGLRRGFGECQRIAREQLGADDSWELRQEFGEILADRLARASAAEASEKPVEPPAPAPSEDAHADVFDEMCAEIRRRSDRRVLPWGALAALLRAKFGPAVMREAAIRADEREQIVHAIARSNRESAQRQTEQPDMSPGDPKRKPT